MKLRQLLLSATFILAVMVIPNYTIAQTTLNDGDIAVLSLDGNGTEKEFHFVTFVDLDAGTVIYFTDVDTDGDFTIPTPSGPNGIISYTAPVGGIDKGTVILYNSDSPVAEFATEAGGFQLGSGGDNITAYQGTDEINVTTYLHVVASFKTFYGSLPAGVDDTLFFNAHDGEYNGPRVGLPADLFDSINDPTKWVTNNSGVSPLDVTEFTPGYVWSGTGWISVDPSGTTVDEDIIIDGTGATLSANTTTNGNFRMTPGSTMDFDGFTLTVAGDATMEADASGYSQIIGDIDGTSNYQSYLTSASGRWFNLAFPIDTNMNGVSGIPLQATGSDATTNIWYYDATVDNDANDEGDFIAVPNMMFDTELTGFQVWAGDGTNFGSAPFTLNTEGILIDGTQTISVSDFTVDNFNIIPNPFPSTLDWDLVFADGDNSELQATYYIQDGSNDDGNYAYRTYNASTTAFTNGGSANIPPGQSFFIEVNATGDLLLKNSHRNITGSTGLYKTAAPLDYIQISAKHLGNGMEDQTVLAIDQSLTDGKDRMDGGKFMNKGFPNIYTQIGSKEYTYNGISDQFSKRSVDVGFQGDYDGVYVINLPIDLLPASWSITLEDKLTQAMIDIRNNPYAFNHQSTNSPDRFVLHINQSAVSLEEVDTEDIYAYFEGGQLNINLSEVKNAQVDIFDVSGKQLYSESSLEGTVKVAASEWAKGLYLINVSKGGKQVLSTKVIN